MYCESEMIEEVNGNESAEDNPENFRPFIQQEAPAPPRQNPNVEVLNESFTAVRTTISKLFGLLAQKCMGSSANRHPIRE